MAHYPPLAHIAAVMLGRWPAGSTLNGMFAVCAVSIYLVYAGLSVLLRRHSFAATAISFTVFLVAAAVAKYPLVLVGREIIDHYFFSQLAGNALVVVGVIGSAKAARRSFAHFLVASGLLVFITGWVYVLSAIQLAAACLTISALRLFDKNQGRSQVIRTAAIAAALFAALVALNPTFLNAYRIADLGGSISISMATVVLVTAIMPMPIVLLLWQRRSTSWNSPTR